VSWKDHRAMLLPTIKEQMTLVRLEEVETE
jgi:hypothetical protein